MSKITVEYDGIDTTVIIITRSEMNYLDALIEAKKDLAREIIRQSKSNGNVTY